MTSLLIIDGLNLIRRIYEAIPAEDSPEKVVGAAKSCGASVRRALYELRPSHVICVMDLFENNWRHDLYDQYKINRKPPPIHFANGIQTFLDAFAFHGVKAISRIGYEADDIIALLTSKWCESSRYPVTILSTDKDMLQLVNSQVKCRNHFTDTWMDEAYIKEKYGLKPSQIADYLALVGDSVDGVPGIENIGPKTAVKLLKMYGDIDGLMRHANEISGKTGIKFRAGMKDLPLWRQMVGFNTNVSLGLTMSEFKIP